MQYTIDFAHRIFWEKSELENTVHDTDIQKKELLKIAENLGNRDVLQLIRSHQIITFDFDGETVSGNHDIFFEETMPYPTERIFPVITLHIDGMGKKKYHLLEFFEEKNR